MEAKISNYILLSIIIISTAMFIWTLNTITNANQIYTHTTISAFNG